ncbi:MAG: hypothetical protein A2W90_19065 [Bacteroidetes bacterium GWF2_42_66]|nr:MAG: hypothetical protein A2W92_05875 [Bacteroidetes bacterium GWA2_42_15]OFX98730.1 MAG: hypothetical protein A2W89_10630 [Bacteroidetes bacterium GWE2_42_39]OFY43072.1 MAG: hypothetical protein A2W90_19065 [Bacteroidetes bacterium GWF2_42_66]
MRYTIKIALKTAFPVLLFLAIFSCKNQDWDFPDYRFSSTYFPYQTPVRTLVLGDYDEVDNTKDKNLQFSIGVAIGGMYENDRDRKVGYVLDESLTQNLYTSAGDTLVPLPQAYYELSPVGTMIVPKGSMQGFIDVQLNDAFLNDPKAFKNHYVVPLRLTSTETDSILSGKTDIANPDPRIAAYWNVAAPKDFTLYGIKYINPYHGHFLYRGKTVIKDASGTKVDEVVYRNKYVEKNAVVMITTTGRSQVELTNMIRMSAGSPGNFKARLSFDAQGSACTVTAAPGSAYPVSGTGKFIKEGDEWGGKKRNTIILSYNCPVYYTPTPPEPIRTTVNNADASINYVGSSWQHNTETGCYNNDRSYSNVKGAYFTFNFTGNEIVLYYKTGSSYGSIDVYLDDILLQEGVSLVTSSTLYQRKVFETTCTYGDHTLKVVVGKSGSYSIFDYLTYGVPDPNAPPVLPAGDYSFEANDTLVIRDRAVVLETFTPVIK